MSGADLDPEAAALLYVQQYLAENGYGQALQALETQCGVSYDEDKLERGSVLMQLVWQKFEDEASCLADEAAAQAKEEEELLRGGRGDYPKHEFALIEGVHQRNITCIQLVPQHDLVLTGSGDGVLHLFDFNGKVMWAAELGPGGILCVDLQMDSAARLHMTSSPDEPPSGTALVGMMSGMVHVIQLSTGKLLGSHQAHRKYVVAAKWVGGSLPGVLATASWDHSIGVHQWSAEGGGMETLKQVMYQSAVHDVLVLPGSSIMAVAIRDTNYLRLIDLGNLEQEEKHINLNARGDDHVSFYAAHLAASPCGKYLLVSTSGAQLLVLSTADWRQVRVVHGLPVAQFHQPCALWSRDSCYVLAAGADAQVKVFHVGKAKLEASLVGHKTNVRGLSYDAERNILATCSYDKTVRLWNN